MDNNGSVYPTVIGIVGMTFFAFLWYIAREIYTNVRDSSVPIMQQLGTNSTITDQIQSFGDYLFVSGWILVFVAIVLLIWVFTESQQMGEQVYAP